MDSTSLKTVSAIIASYNCGNYLAKAVDSLLAQSYPPREIIVVDDGSTDHTAEVARSYGEILIYIHQENRGEAGARNRAMEVASSDYIAVQDADDVCATNRLERQVAEMERNPQAIACFTGHWVFDEQGKVSEYFGNTCTEGMDSLTHLGRCVAFGPTLLFDRRKASGLHYPLGIKCGPDMVFVSLLRNRGPFLVLRDLLYGYRRRSGQITNRYSLLDGFEHRLNWVRANWNCHWPDRTLPTIENAMWSGLVSTLADFYWARDRQRFLRLRTYLRANWPSNMQAAAEIAWHWYPDWLWRGKELLRRIVPEPVWRTAVRPGGSWVERG